MFAPDTHPLPETFHTETFFLPAALSSVDTFPPSDTPFHPDTPFLSDNFPPPPGTGLPPGSLTLEEIKILPLNSPHLLQYLLPVKTRSAWSGGNLWKGEEVMLPMAGDF